MKKIITLIALMTLVTTFAFATTPPAFLQLNMHVEESIATKITDGHIAYAALFDESVILTVKEVVLDNANSATDTEFYFNILTNKANATLQVSVRPVSFMRQGGGASAIKYWIYETDKSGNGLLSAGSTSPFQNFYTVTSAGNGQRMLDSRKLIVEVSNEDFQSTVAGDFQATIALQVSSN
ncbi:MAG: hypothetical protein JEY71_01130 [Sphaerochaeta sp.]|nr:hypothetical protein [Sphaerochaeta sp.]